MLVYMMSLMKIGLLGPLLYPMPEYGEPLLESPASPTFPLPSLSKKALGNLPPVKGLIAIV